MNFPRFSHQYRANADRQCLNSHGHTGHHHGALTAPNPGLYLVSVAMLIEATNAKLPTTTVTTLTRAQSLNRRRTERARS